MFSTVAIYVIDAQKELVRKRLDGYGKLDYRAIEGPGDKDGCVFVMHDVPRRGRDHGFLTQELMRGITAYDYIMFMQDSDDPQGNDVVGMAWGNPYGLDFVCKRYIAVNGEAVIND